jgi:hypothetical protein
MGFFEIDMVQSDFCRERGDGVASDPNNRYRGWSGLFGASACDARHVGRLPRQDRLPDEKAFQCGQLQSRAA